MQDWSRRSALGALAAAAAAPGALAQATAISPYPPVAMWLTEGGHVVVEVSVDGARALGMITNNAPGYAIDAGFAKRSNLESSSDRLPNGAATRANRNVPVTLGPVQAKLAPVLIDLSFAAMELPNSQRQLLVMLGRGVLDEARMLFDFDAKQLWLVKQNERGKLKPPADMTPLKMTKGKNAPPTLRVTLEGAEVDAIIDFSSPAPLQVTYGAMTDRWLADGRLWSSNSSYSQGLNSSAEFKNILCTLKSMRLGPHELHNIPVSVYAAAGGADTATPKVVIGPALLSRFLMLYDPRRLELALKPGAAFANPFAKATVGLGLEPDLRKVIVHDIAENSPAAGAGFKRGDEIVTINGAPATRNGIRLAKAGDTLVLVLADGSSHTVEAKEYY